MPITPGYYMPSMYGNQYYPQVSGASLAAQNAYSPAPQQPNTQGIIWVDGEVGAKAYQIPQGWPVGSPIALWDTNDTVIYLKSINQMGMPNPLQKITYKMEEQQALPAAQTNSVSHSAASNYATKDDLEEMKKEMKELLRSVQSQVNQNGSQSQQNRGGSR